MSTEFWATIADVKRESRSSGKDFHDAMLRVLGKKKVAEIAAFYRGFEAAKDALRSPRVEAAARLIFADGLSDDTWEDFLDWIMSQGRSRYRKVLSDPDTLADRLLAKPQLHAWMETALSGGILFAYEKKTKRRLDADDLQPDAVAVEEASPRAVRAQRKLLPRLGAARKQIDKQAAARLKAAARRGQVDLGAAFWPAVDAMRERAGRRGGISAGVKAALKACSPDEIRDFYLAWRKAQAALDTPLFWAAALVIACGGGGGDEELEAFRTWVILRGRASFENTLADPDSLVELVLVRAPDEVPGSKPVEPALLAAWLAAAGPGAKPNGMHDGPGPQGASLSGLSFDRLLDRLPRMRELMFLRM